MGAFALLSWGFFAVLVALIVIGGIVVLRRYRRWTPTEATTPEAKAAEARLWATKIGDQGGGR